MKILIVEDDTSSRIFLENMLAENGYQYRSAINGLDGLSVFKEFQPDLVISDIQMPVMDGLEMIEKIFEQNPETIIIITTVLGSQDNSIKAFHLGASNYLKKPVEAMNLLPLLKKYKAILGSKSSNTTPLGNILYKKFRIVFKTDIKKIPQIVDRLLIETVCNLNNNDRINTELGLVELITNAFEHGNLEISLKDKTKALENNQLEALYQSKMEDERLASRGITIDFTKDKTGCEWEITDDGNGFDWENLPDPTAAENIMELNGRGIFISSFLFDEIEYSGKGNTVRVKKYYSCQNEKHQHPSVFFD